MSDLTIAAIRMDAAPAPLEGRLERALRLVARAAAQGARLVVLPEVFNTGYVYDDSNYRLAEPIDGRTVVWMKGAARRHGVHLAGTLLLREPDGIYNAMLLVAPDGRIWRYDKSYPWGWERAYFRPRKAPLRAAETDLGRIGMLICWDVAHPGLWRRYAGKVDLLIACSCPPLGHQFDFRFPDGSCLDISQLGPVMRSSIRGADGTYNRLLLRQAAWLGVPCVQATGAGRFVSALPRPQVSLFVCTLTRPGLWKHLPDAEHVRISAGYFADTFVADASGGVLARTRLDADDLAIATVALADSPPAPRTRQPGFGLSPLVYWMDRTANALLRGYYRQRWQIRTD